MLSSFNRRMNHYIRFILLPFIFLIFIQIVAINTLSRSENIEKDKFLELRTKSRFYNAGNYYLYKEDTGSIIFGRNNGHFSDEIPIYFNTIGATCNADSKQKEDKTINFDMVFCIPENRTCDDGMIICYAPQLINDNIKEEYREKCALKNLDESGCEDESHHGIKITIDKNDNVKIKLSFDKHIYTFKLPPTLKEKSIFNRCFKIRFGNGQSVSAIVTNMQDEKLIFTGTPPINIEKSFHYKVNKDVMKFWLLTLDFVPMADPWFKDSPFTEYSQKIIYKTSRSCTITVQMRNQHSKNKKLFGCYTETELIDGMQYNPDDTLMTRERVITTGYELTYTTSTENVEENSQLSQNQLTTGLNVDEFSVQFSHMENSGKRNSIKTIIEQIKKQTKTETMKTTFTIAPWRCCGLYYIDIICMGWKIKRQGQTKKCSIIKKDYNTENENFDMLLESNECPVPT